MAPSPAPKAKAQRPPRSYKGLPGGAPKLAAASLPPPKARAKSSRAPHGRTAANAGVTAGAVGGKRSRRHSEDSQATSAKSTVGPASVEIEDDFDEDEDDKPLLIGPELAKTEGNHSTPSKSRSSCSRSRSDRRRRSHEAPAKGEGGEGAGGGGGGGGGGGRRSQHEAVWTEVLDLSEDQEDNAGVEDVEVESGHIEEEPPAVVLEEGAAVATVELAESSALPDSEEAAPLPQSDKVEDEEMAVPDHDDSDPSVSAPKAGGILEGTISRQVSGRPPRQRGMMPHEVPTEEPPTQSFASSSRPASSSEARMHEEPGPGLVKRLVLLCGDLQGQFDVLHEKLVRLEEEGFRVDFVLAAGNCLPNAPGMSSYENYLGQTPKFTLPKPVYIVDSEADILIQESVKSGFAAISMARNLTFLGACGVQKVMGLRIAFLSGRCQDASDETNWSCEPFPKQATQPSGRYSSSAVQEVERQRTDKLSAEGGSIDILLTSEWPDLHWSVSEHSMVPVCGEVQRSSMSSPAVRELLYSLKPRYHVCAGADVAEYRKSDQGPYDFVCTSIAMAIVKPSLPGSGSTEAETQTQTSPWHHLVEVEVSKESQESETSQVEPILAPGGLECLRQPCSVALPAWRSFEESEPKRKADAVQGSGDAPPPGGQMEGEEDGDEEEEEEEEKEGDDAFVGGEAEGGAAPTALAAPPPGWEIRLSRTHNTEYYFHLASGRSSWVFPEGEA